ncbi:hypothetical protein K458DRAFT_133836 [Lentithecium fluviatile CBS 122367]|uniref:Uncharacterized protein n=1 Tax=Lentithecium fluviatile CBS 122367 TaxID=1168545 RepID=A0A6G1IKY1_9PLEO|nr:hypothetical protein K458DRAFT_133836 [Lentithecium fluviatile CBS 122367]
MSKKSQSSLAVSPSPMLHLCRKTTASCRLCNETCINSCSGGRGITSCSSWSSSSPPLSQDPFSRGNTSIALLSRFPSNSSHTSSGVVRIDAGSLRSLYGGSHMPICSPPFTAKRAKILVVRRSRTRVPRTWSHSTRAYTSPLSHSRLALTYPSLIPADQILGARFASVIFLWVSFFLVFHKGYFNGMAGVPLVTSADSGMRVLASLVLLVGLRGQYKYANG